MTKLADELEVLHNNAKGAEFDLTPYDGPIAQLALFMHNNGDSVIAALRQPTPDAGDMQGLVERLREGVTPCGMDGDIELFDVAEADECMFEAAAAIQSLTARLEMVPGWSQDADGIACRDATIEGLDAQLAAERAKVAELVEGLAVINAHFDRNDAEELPDYCALEIPVKDMRSINALLERMMP